MLMAIYKEILKAFEDEFQKFVKEKANEYPECFNFNWIRLKSEIKNIEKDLVFDHDLRDVVLNAIIKLLRRLHEDGMLDFCDVMLNTNRILDSRYKTHRLYGYMCKINVSKNKLESLFTKTC